jgi:hypothetical protein
MCSSVAVAANASVRINWAILAFLPGLSSWQQQFQGGRHFYQYQTCSRLTYAHGGNQRVKNPAEARTSQITPLLCSTLQLRLAGLMFADAVAAANKHFQDVLL